MKRTLQHNNKRIFFIALFSLVALISLLFYMRGGSNELVGESNLASTPCEGVSLEVSATAEDITYTIRSQEIDYITYDGFQRSMKLEMLKDGKWFVVNRPKLHMDMPEPISPGTDFTRTIRWKDFYKYNLSEGKYRLIFLFWAMEDGKQSKNYNAIAEFVID
ncbi:MAG: hypothetical protein K0R34_1291 [Herbinix sp.]|jgi:hypothetical protein|nr:hypothetical protein [Herbinix sp.]